MVDLDSNPTKVIEIIEIGKQLPMTRGAVTTFSIAKRRGPVLRDHPGDAHPRMSAAACAQRDAPGDARIAAVIFKAIDVLLGTTGLA
jgi:high-affinity K+ transport system ATPase subunit B